MAEWTAKAVSDVHIEQLYTSRAALVRGAITNFAFSPEEEHHAIAALVARLFDDRAVCRIAGPNRSHYCPNPGITDGMIGIAFNSMTSSCVKCNNTIIADLLPSTTAPIFDAMNSAGETLGPGDVIAFLGGPILPSSVQQTAQHVWWHAPAHEDFYSAYVDLNWETRAPTCRTAVQQRLHDAPHVCAWPRAGTETEDCPGSIALEELEVLVEPR